MKYLLFGLAAMIGVPVMAAFATFRPRAREWLASLMVFATALTGPGPFKINFVSMEWYRGPDRGFEVTLVDLVALALSTSLVLRDRRKVAWFPWNTGWMLAYFVIAVASVMDTREPVLSAFTLFKLVRAYGLYWCTVNLLRAGVPLRAFWHGMMGIAFYVALVAVKQKYLHGIYRVSGPFDHSNMIPLYLNQFLPLAVAVGLAEGSRRRAILSLVASGAMLFTVILTYSRAGMALAVLAVLTTLWYANRRAPSRRVRVASVVTVALVLAVGAVTARGVIARFIEAPEASKMARDEFNAAADQMLADHPFGVGVNQFPHVMTNAPEYRRFVAVMAAEEQAGVCHHIYRLTAAEMGWAGLGVMLVIYLRFAGRAAHFALRRRGPDALLFASLAIGAVALHLSGFLEWGFRVTPIFFMYFICCGIIAGHRDRLAAEEAAEALEARIAGGDGTAAGAGPAPAVTGGGAS